MKTHFKLFAGIGLISAFFTVALISCQKSSSFSSAGTPSHPNLSIYMTDGPGFFDKIYIDVRQVAIKVDTSADHLSSGDNMSSGEDWHNHQANHEGDDIHEHDQEDEGAVWDTLPIKPGIYDLLHFSNGADTVLAQGQIPKGRIISFRLTLGPNNSLVKDSISYPLNLWQGDDNVYIRIFGPELDEVNASNYRFWIDFNADRSVIRMDDGQFYLRPWLHAFAESNTGSIEGRVLPMAAYPVISVFNSADTLYAIPDKDGGFRINGLQQGTYGVFVNTSNGYLDTTLLNVNINVNQNTNVGTVQLHQ
ncbi:MAG: DUF4382 domain-containing protein [Chitinophagaceae bacterium]